MLPRESAIAYTQEKHQLKTIFFNELKKYNCILKYAVKYENYICIFSMCHSFTNFCAKNCIVLPCIFFIYSNY